MLCSEGSGGDFALFECLVGKNMGWGHRENPERKFRGVFVEGCRWRVDIANWFYSLFCLHGISLLEYSTFRYFCMGFPGGHP